MDQNNNAKYDFWTVEFKYGLGMVCTIIVIALLFYGSQGGTTGERCICPEYGICNMTEFIIETSDHTRNDTLTRAQLTTMQWDIRQRMTYQECLNNKTVIKVVTKCIDDKWEILEDEYN